jgi:MFS family permease
MSRFARWLLGTDRPAPAWDEEQRLGYQSRWLRFNFAVNVTEGACFWLGMSFASSATILPLFISKLTPSKLALGFVAAMAASGWALPQLFTANFVERLVHKKAVVVNLGFFAERVPICFWPVAALLAVRWPVAALLLFLATYAWQCLGAGIIATGWQDMVANCFPVGVRGRLFGAMVVVGSGVGIFGAKLSKHLIETYPFPTNFALAFTLAAAGVMGSCGVLALTREPVHPIIKPHETHREYFRNLPALWRADPNLRAFLAARLLLVFGGMGIGFFTVSAVERWHVPDSMAGDFTAALMIGQVLGNLLFGLLSDRHGHKISLQLGATIACLANVMACCAPDPRWYYAVFVCLGLSGGAFFVSGILFVMELATPERRPTYTGLVNTCIGVVGALGPLLGSLIALLGYRTLFAFAACVQVAGILLLTLTVHDPRRAPAALADG